MREIRFRGKVLDDSLVYGYLTYIPEHESWGILEDTSKQPMLVDPNSIDQYTGKYDTECEEICENDIVLYQNEEYMVVWLHTSFVLVSMNTKAATLVQLHDAVDIKIVHK